MAPVSVSTCENAHMKRRRLTFEDKVEADSEDSLMRSPFKVIETESEAEEDKKDAHAWCAQVRREWHDGFSEIDVPEDDGPVQLPEPRTRFSSIAPARAGELESTSRSMRTASPSSDDAPLVRKSVQSGIVVR